MKRLDKHQKGSRFRQQLQLRLGHAIKRIRAADENCKGTVNYDPDKSAGLPN